MIDLEEFVVTAEFGQLADPIDFAALRDFFGDPDSVDKLRKKRVARYGGIEFWFWSGKLTSIGFTLHPEEPLDGGGIAVTGFWPESKRAMEYVAELLRSRQVTWTIDQRLSELNPEDNSQTWVTSRHVHLGFIQGVLQRVVADFEHLFMPAPH